MTDERALRTSIEQRLANKAADENVALDRVRRHFVFQRILVRLAEAEGWVLKGGFALEVRLGLKARATKDLDLATLEALTGVDVQNDLLDALDVDAGDDLSFDVSPPKPITPDEAGNPGWKFSITARLGGRVFASLRLDVVARTEEISGGVDTIDIPPLILRERLSGTTMPTVDIAQHAAEKFHAMSRVYGGSRPSSRVKDLVDIVLLAEAELLPHPDLRQRLIKVWQVRDNEDPPSTLPEFPVSWSRDYDAMARDLDLSVDFPTASTIAARLFVDATPNKEIHT